MIQEEEDLLKKVLCEMLPYGVMVHGVFLNYNKETNKIQYEYCDREFSFEDLRRMETLKPYLRPMSSMTNDERFEYLDFLKVEIQDGGWVSENYVVSLADMPMLIDWLNAHHFDYKGLIKKGLAIEAPEGMYNN